MTPGLLCSLILCMAVSACAPQASQKAATPAATESATVSGLRSALGVFVGSDDVPYVTDWSACAVWRYANAKLSLVAGSRICLPPGGVGLPTPISGQLLTAPTGIAGGASGTVYVNSACAVRVIAPSGQVSVLEGTQSCPRIDDPGASQTSNTLRGVAVDGSGNVYFAVGCSIRLWSEGKVATVVGGDDCAVSVADGPAGGAMLSTVTGLALGPDGTLYFAEGIPSCRVRSLQGGVIKTVAGLGVCGLGGDGGSALDAELNDPQGLALGSRGEVYIADWFNNRVRKVEGGVITTVAGGGTGAASRDPQPGSNVSLDPVGLSISPEGDLYVANFRTCDIVRLSQGEVTLLLRSDSCAAR
jgi:sugar lactone lactonase YvrE